MKCGQNKQPKGEWVPEYEEYLDANENPIKKGDRVRIANLDKRDIGDSEFYGTITGISDPDGDVDDEGRSIGIPPRVTILFDDGGEESFNGFIPSKYYSELAYGHEFDDVPIPYVFEDIELDK
jgi:hypothetical protein